MDLDRMMDNIRIERGISLDVWEARPYTPWTPDDITPILDAYWGLADSQVRFMASLARQQPGVIIHRHPVPGAPHVWPEIRPEDLVRTGPPTMHWHGEGEPPELGAGYQILPRGTEAWEQHCRRVNEDELEPDEVEPHEEYLEPHWHKNLAKYCFPPARWEVEPWDHDHSDRYYAEDPENLEVHLARWHKEPPIILEDGKHRHYRRVKSRDSLARRLDVHPMALPLFDNADLVYFGIEGCLKADAILSEIIRQGRRESVFSVPSVSLWDTPWFDSFLPLLQGKRVVVVPDADWYRKRQVLAHARFAQRYLKNHGIEAVIAAPPLASGQKGIDDYLGAGGGLDDLEVLDRAPSPKIPEVVELRHRRGEMRKDGLRNSERMIRDLAFFADEEGYVQVSHRTMARILGVNRNTVGKHLKKQRDFAWIEIEQQNKPGVWELCTGEIKTKSGYVQNGRYFRGPLQFKSRTRIRVHELLRSQDLDPRPLGE
jgi:hypothetical protein